MTKSNSSFARNGRGAEVPYDVLERLLGEDENILLARVHPSGMILSANAMLAAAAGEDRVTLVGQSLLDYLERDHLPLLPDILTAAHGGSGMANYDVHLLGPGQIHCPLACQFIADGGAVVVLAGIDVLQLQGAYEELAASAQDLSEMLQVQSDGRRIAEQTVLELEKEIVRRTKAERRLAEARDNLEAQVEARTRDLRLRTKALEVSEHRNRDFANLSADYFFMTDADLRYTYVSATVADTAVSVIELIGRTRGEVFAEYRGGDLDDEELRAQTDRQPYRDIQRTSDMNDQAWLRASGQPRFSADGTFLGYIGVNSEITEFRRQQEALANSEANYRRLVEEARQGIHIIDDGRIIFANRAQVAMFGYDSVAEVIALGDVRLLSVPQERERLSAYMQKRQQGEDAPADYTVEGLRKDGSTFPLRLSIQQVIWEGRMLVANTLVNVEEEEQVVVPSPRLAE
jgi:PAS domain S-box-containing protein